MSFLSENITSGTWNQTGGPINDPEYPHRKNNRIKLYQPQTERQALTMKPDHQAQYKVSCLVAEDI